MKRNIKGLLVLLLLFVSAGSFSQDKAESKAKKVLVFDIRAEIDPRSNRHVKLALEEARKINADLVIIDMDTYGGTLVDADTIRKRLLNLEIPVHVWINNNAASAGALISLATDSIFMAPGSTIGSATVVDGQGVPAPDKYQSYMRKLMRSTAEQQGRNPELAERMVGEPREDGGVGRVLALTTTEALEADIADATAISLDEIMEHLNIKDYKLIRYERSRLESVISFFLNPVVQSVLLLMIMGGLYFELQTPGVGFPLIAAVIGAVLYFLPSYLTGLAEMWEIIIVLVGTGMVIAEFFVIPGFGILGISGIILMVAGMMLSLLNNDFFDFRFVPPGDVTQALTIVAAGILGGILVVFAAAGRFMESEAFKKISGEKERFTNKEGYHSSFHKKDLTGAIGTTFTILRPSGKIKIGDEVFIAHSSGEWIDQGVEVKVVEGRSGSLKVREVKQS